MRLWMLTKPGFPAIAARHDRLFASWDLVEDPEVFERPYRWMVAQMAGRGLDTAGCPPFWAWHSYGAPGKRVDLRVYRQPVPTLRLTLDVPNDLVLLSDEESWHAVLNNFYLSASEAEHDKVEKLEDTGKLSQAKKEASWQRIFDLSQYGDPHWMGLAEERCIQACLPWIQHAWIRDVEHFKGHTPQNSA